MEQGEEQGGSHIPAFQQGMEDQGTKEKIFGGELPLYLLLQVTVSVLVKQVGAGGYRRGVQGGRIAGSGCKVFKYFAKIKEKRVC